MNTFSNIGVGVENKKSSKKKITRASLKLGNSFTLQQAIGFETFMIEEDKQV